MVCLVVSNRENETTHIHFLPTNFVLPLLVQTRPQKVVWNRYIYYCLPTRLQAQPKKKKNEYHQSDDVRDTRKLSSCKHTLANILLWTKNENKEGKRSNGDYFLSNSSISGTAILGPYIKSVISGPAYVSIYSDFKLPFAALFALEGVRQN